MAAKHFHSTVGVITLLILQCTWTTLWGQSFSGTFTEDIQEDPNSGSTDSTFTRVIRNKSQCNRGDTMRYKTKYKVFLALDGSICEKEPEKSGFHCKYSFHYEDEFDRIGYALCVDMRGISDAMPTNQLLFTVIDETQNKEIKRLYNTHFSSVKPFSACAAPDSSKISVSYDVKDVVRVCKNNAEYTDEPSTVMELITKQAIPMGTVALRQQVPIYTMPEDSCFTSIMADVFPQYMVKVDTRNFAQNRLICSLKFSHHLPNDPIEVCIKLVYLSQDLDCAVTLALSAEGLKTDQRGLKFDSHDDLDGKDALCYVFQSGKPVLSIHKGSKRCIGKFSAFVNFTLVDAGYPDSGDYSDSAKQRNVMMAVFVSLVSACLLILGVTCICCLRMRSKRARQRARARANRHANHNEAFSSPPAPPVFPGISWHDADPNHVAGLPTYEEVTGQSSQDEPDKPEMPPSYDSIYEPSSPSCPPDITNDTVTQ